MIDETGKQLGIIPTREALALAQDRELDLVEVAPQAKPPVCKIIDYGKYLYEMKKQAKMAKKKQTIIKMHEIKFGVRTDEHDLQHKLRKVREFLEDGDKVKATVFFRGREARHRDLGRLVLDKVTEKLKDIAEIEQRPKFEGRTLFMVIAPLK